MIEHMDNQTKRRLIAELQGDIWKLERQPNANTKTEVAALRAAVAALEGGVVPNTGRASTPTPPSPASLKRPVPRAGASGDPRLAKLNAIVRRALGEDKKLGTKIIGAYQFCGVASDFDPYESTK